MPRDPGRAPRIALPRRGRVLVPTLVILVVLGVGFALFSTFYTELLWYRSVDASGVFTRRIGVHVGLFVVFGGLLGGAVAGNTYLAHRLRPTYIPGSAEQQSLDRYRMGIEPLRKVAVIALGVVLGLLAGLSASSHWKTYLLWRNGTPFGKKDPQFGKDISFFVFDLPWIRFVLSFAFTLVVLCLLASALTHYLYGGVRLQGFGDRTTDAARVHLSVLLGLFVLLKAVAYYIDRYSLAVRESKVGRADFTGLTYTDINALLPAKTILAWVALICAVLFFANVVRRTWLLPALGLGSLVIAAVLIGGLYPAVYQQFRVKPSEADREAAQITKNIQQTRAAYGLDAVKVQGYAAQRAADVQTAAASPTLASSRLIDPYVVSPTFTARQQGQTWYEFPDPLDIDRYTIDGKETEVAVAVREVDTSKLNASQRNWTNERTVYTHGYGFVAAATDNPNTEGEPSFLSSDSFGKFEPRVYFGEESPDYSIVGAPKGAQPVEADDPSGSSRSNTYQGGGGVEVGSLFHRVLYATKYRDSNLLLSNRVNSSSRILYDREPRDRVEKVAPWLTVDGDPYPAVVGGRIVWIVDGYTTSSSYPYSTRQKLGEATADAVTQTSSVVAQQDDRRVNYIRNSVKATVDAYTGQVTLYQWDTSDPVLKAWRKAFPGTVHPRADLDKNTELLAHVRYPEDLFKVQRELYTRYHVSDPRVFYSNNDFWKIPQDPTGDVKQDLPPYYLTLQMPGTSESTFSLTTPFSPIGNRENLTGFMSVDSDATDPDSYGTLRVLTIPAASAQINGPQLAQSAFKSNTAIAQQISLLQRGGASEVVYGNLLTLPAGRGFLYVEPIYVRPTAGTARFPTLQLVLVSDGINAAYGNSLAAALTELERGGGTPSSGDTSGSGTAPQTSATPSPSASTGATPTPGTGTLAATIADAEAAFQAGQRALRDGDFTAYGEAQKRLQAAIERLAQLSPKPTPTG
ncbi:hypothetical protein CLV35_2782 [Motilibacter peucedani]|uniref:UPF0182 protein CLV35_2782 n=2 Tax=Motilibacter peucedani TaxID=598650 RepID=A0A420XMP3_9ACTN|nr:hypothetical protein CLV35_2782 [Motilibacter peucedani]